MMVRRSLLCLVLPVLVSSVYSQALDWKPFTPTHRFGRGASSIYAAACDSGGTVYALSNAVSISTDEGHSWRISAIGSASDVAAGPHAGEAFLAGTALLYTSDAGQHWTRIGTSDPSAFCAFADDGWLYYAQYGGFYASAGPAGAWTKSGLSLTVMDLWVDHDSKVSVFGYNAKDTGIFRSSDHGLTWKKSCSVPRPYAGFGVSEDGKGRIAVHVDGGPELLSTDFGATWSTSDSMFFYLGDVTVVVPRQYGGISIFQGTVRPFVAYGNPLCLTPNRTVICGSSCSQAPYDAAYPISISVYTPDFIFGRSDSDVFISSGVDAYPKQGPYDRTAVDSDGYFYERAGNGSGRRVNVYTPTDSSKWTVLDAPPIFQLRGAPERSVYASGTYGILYHSTDRGWSWDEITAGTGRLLYFDISKEGVFFVVNDSGTVYRSTDTKVWSISGTAPGNILRFYATTRGLVAYRDSNRVQSVWTSADDGVTWREVATPTPLEDIDVLPDGSLVALTPQHVYLRRSQTWRAIDERLPRQLDTLSTSPLFSAIGHDAGGHLYIGEVNGGLYRSGITYDLLSAPKSGALDASSLTVYPNPATTSLTINCPAGTGSVTLFDQLGRDVRTEKVTGTSLNINVADLPRGTYWLRTDGHSTASVESVVLK
jgi:photosystem II stability/assembly factor-like uncharacterized protein